MDNTIVYLCPDYISSTIKISKKNTQKGTYTGMSYYKGFNKYNVYGYFKDDEIATKIKEIKFEKNNFDTILTINKSEITPQIIKYFRYVEPKIEYPEQPLLIDPYILGLWLGDGHSNIPALTNIDIPIIEVWKNYASIINSKITINNIKERKTENIKQNETQFVASYHVVQNINYNGIGGNILLNNLKKYKLINNKHIPPEYLQNSFENRLKLLAGLIDTDGSLSRGCYEISQKNEALSNDIVTLCRSLGFYTRITKGEKSCMYKETKRTGSYYRIIISLNQFSTEVPVLLERKMWKYNSLSDKNICNPFIDIDGNVIEKIKIEWSDNMKIMLYSIVQKILQIQPNMPIPWCRFGEFDNLFNNCSPRALDTLYSKTLLPNKEVYDKMIIDVKINLIEKEWMNKYNQIKKILLENKKTFVRSKYPTLYNWFQHQLHQLKNYNLQKKSLIAELHTIQMEIL